MYIRLLVQCHTCPISPPVHPLTLTLPLSWANLPYRLFTFHIPNLISILLSLGNSTKESIWSPLWHFVPTLFLQQGAVSPTPNPQVGWPTCQLSVTAYSVYLQLPSITGGRLLYPQPDNAVVKRNTPEALKNIVTCFSGCRYISQNKYIKPHWLTDLPKL
jgi:hypothetical protein